jgi:hypothetical protein
MLRDEIVDMLLLLAGERIKPQAHTRAADLAKEGGGNGLELADQSDRKTGEIKMRMGRKQLYMDRNDWVARQDGAMEGETAPAEKKA